MADEYMGPAASGTARAGKAPWLTLTVDSNGDGVPDTGFARTIAGVIGGILAAARPFAAPGTWVANTADEWFTKVLPAISAVTK